MAKQGLIICIVIVAVFAALFLLRGWLKIKVEEMGVYKTPCFVVKKYGDSFKCELTHKGKEYFGNVSLISYGDTIEEAYNNAVIEVRKIWKEQNKK